MSGEFLTVEDRSALVGRDLLILIEAVVEHRLDVLTDSDWFAEVVADLQRQEERPGPWPV